jgi:hypothetical protein
MTDKAPPQSRKLVPQKVGPVDKRRRPRGLTKAIRTAIDTLIHDRCTRDQACEKAGISERALYLALQKPEVAAYWNGQIDVLRTAERPASLFALIEVRDGVGHSNAMARVNAAKSLLDQGDAVAATGAQVRPAPGLQIVLIQPTALEPKTINVVPVDITPTRGSDNRG